MTFLTLCKWLALEQACVTTKLHKQACRDARSGWSLFPDPFLTATQKLWLNVWHSYSHNRRAAWRSTQLGAKWSVILFHLSSTKLIVNAQIQIWMQFSTLWGRTWGGNRYEYVSGQWQSDHVKMVPSSSDRSHWTQHPFDSDKPSNKRAPLLSRGLVKEIYQKLFLSAPYKDCNFVRKVHLSSHRHIIRSEKQLRFKRGNNAISTFKMNWWS